MATPPRKRRLSPKARRSLELLAGNPFGVTEALVFAFGPTRGMLAGLMRAGLATVQRETVKADGKPIEIGRVRITDAGQKTLKAVTAQRPAPHPPEAR